MRKSTDTSWGSAVSLISIFGKRESGLEAGAARETLAAASRRRLTAAAGRTSKRLAATAGRLSGQSSHLRQALVRLPAGAWFGEEALRGETTRPYSAVAVRLTTLLVMPRQARRGAARAPP